MSEFAIAEVMPGRLNALVKNLMKATGINDPNECVRAINAGEFVLTPVAKAVTTALLAPVGTVSFPGTTEQFVVKKHFVINTSADAKVKISYLGDNFKSWFLDKIEDAVPASELRYQKLNKDSLDAPVVAELGGEEKAETTLAELCHLLLLQKNGEVGTLLISGHANIFYIRDVNGVLRAVFVYWSGDGWDVNAYSVERQDEWFDGIRVFSRNFVTG